MWVGQIFFKLHMNESMDNLSIYDRTNRQEYANIQDFVLKSLIIREVLVSFKFWKPHPLSVRFMWEVFGVCARSSIRWILWSNDKNTPQRENTSLMRTKWRKRNPLVYRMLVTQTTWMHHYYYTLLQVLRSTCCTSIMNIQDCTKHVHILLSTYSHN